MCGIAGEFNYNSSLEASSARLNGMLETIRHRGPDSMGTYTSPDGRLMMGTRRLSIIDLQTGDQPIHSEDHNKWIVFNGEIYNYKALRATLEKMGHDFYTQSDTEVILHAYEAWGDDCTLKLNGMFCFALYDDQRDRLLLARDHYGVKPLYYRDDGNRVMFASEMKAILGQNLAPTAVDEHALGLYLTFGFAPSPHTLVQGINKLPPGHRLVVEKGQTRLERYWSPSPEPRNGISRQETIALLEERMIEAIERQMVSDVPLGVLLSGGVDSSFILAIMSQFSANVNSFTVGFEDAHQTNELDEARKTAEYFGANHHEVIVRLPDFEETLPQMMWHLDEPVGSSSPLAMFYVSQLAGESLKVVLTGQGADEPFAGYFRYYAERYGHHYRRLPEGLRNALIPGVNRLRRNERLKRAARSMGISDADQRFAAEYAVFPETLKSSLYSPELSAGEPSPASVVNYWRRSATELDALSQMTYVDARLSLADDLLMYGDKMSMAASVEARVPFLDLELMDFAESLPGDMRIHRLQRKYAQKKAIANWLPAEILHRRKKGFETPFDSWFQTSLSGFVKQMLTQPDSAVAQYFDLGTIQSIIGSHMRGEESNFRPLYNLLSFEIWHRVFVDGRMKQ